MEGTSLLLTMRLITVEFPEQIDSDLHLAGSKMRFIEDAHFSMLQMIRWWVLVLVDIKLKSICKGVVIMKEGAMIVHNHDSVQFSDIPAER